MSNKNQETIADIVDAMRNEGHTGEASCLEWIRAKMTYYADRIEAAHKREILVERNLATDHIVALQDKAVKIYGEICEMIGREASKNQSVTNCNRLGNAAKMREALEEISAAMNDYEVLDVDYLLEKCNAAISTPPRNCDRPECATTKEAQDVWRKEDGGKTAYYEWLLATSTKGEENENT